MESNMAQIRKIEIRDSLYRALAELDHAEDGMQHNINDVVNNEPADNYTLGMIDNLDLIRVYIRQIERIVKEV